MSHVFISYKREDIAHRDRLMNYLQNKNVPFWVDLNIEAGVGWREEIDAALSDAFALLVIVTDNTPKSHYVTYEWAWALGNRIPVFPLVFEETQVGNLHRKLSSLQFVNCRVDIPTNLGDTLVQHQKQSQLARYANTKICEIISPTMLMLAFTTIFSKYYPDKVTTSDIGAMLYLIDKYTGKLNSEYLPNLWLSTSSSLTPLQQKMFRELGSEIEAIGVILAKYVVLSGLFNASNFGMMEAWLDHHFDSFPSCLPEISTIWDSRLKNLWFFFTDNSHYRYWSVSSDLELARKTDLLGDAREKRETGTKLNLLFHNILYEKTEKHERELFKRIAETITGMDMSLA